MLDRLAAVVVAVFLSGWAAAAQAPAAQFAEFLPKSPMQVKPLTGGASATRAAVLVAGDTYANLPEKERDLPTALTTVQRLREGLVQHGGFAPTAVASLSGERVTAQLVKQAIFEASRKLQPSEDGLLLLGWAGHGWVHYVEKDKGGAKVAEQYLLSYTSKENGALFSEGILLGDLVAWLSDARAEAAKRGVQVKPVVVVDACRVSRGAPPPKVKPIPLAAWQVFGASEGQMVQVGQGGEPFLFLGTLLDQLASFAKLGKAASLDAVFAPAQRATKERSKQTPELLAPSDAALSKSGAPALVVPRRVSLQVRCVDALTGTPLGRASIRVNDDQEAVAEAGELRRLLAPSRVVLATRAEGYLGRTDEVDLEAAELGAEVTLPLLPYVAVVRGRLVPAATAKLQATGGTAREGFHQVEFTTGRDGSFELRVPALLGSELRVVQQGRVLQKFGLPAQPSGFLRDREGKHDGVPLVELVCELNDAALRELGADAPPVATDVNLTDPDDLTDWEQAQQAIAKKRWDLARSRLGRIQGDREKVGVLARQVETRWGVEQLERALAAGKAEGAWEGVANLQAWWAKKPAVDDDKRIAALFAEIERESISLPVRRAVEAGNKAYADGGLEQALAAYEQALAGANQHYRTQLEAQRADIKRRLYRRLASVAFAAELDGDVAKALDAYGKALEHSDRVRGDVERLLEDAKLAASTRGQELLRRLGGTVAPKAGAGLPGALAKFVAERVGTDFEVEANSAVVDGWPKRIVHKPTGLAFVFIPAGKFAMGSPPSEADRSEDELRHQVTISQPFYLAETEVSVAQWRAFAKAAGYRTEAESNGRGGYTHKFNAEGKGEWVMDKEAIWSNPLPYWKAQGKFTVDDSHPVTQVSWNDAMAFCKHYRLFLPTEAEWEYACRAGIQSRFWWGDGEAEGRGRGNFADKGGTGRAINFMLAFDFDDGFQFTAPVTRTVTANAFGLKDMLGNVWEWCADSAEFADGKVVTDTYRDGVVDPFSKSGSQRVLRGGCWSDSALDCRSACRGANGPGYVGSNLGFRPALAARSDVK